VSGATAPWRRLDPRVSVASRLLLGFLLAFCIPGGAFVFLLEQRLSELEHASGRQLAGIRVSDALRRLQENARSRAGWMDRRARLVEDTALTVVDAVRTVLARPVPLEGQVPVPIEPRGRLAIVGRPGGSAAFRLSEHAPGGAARDDLVRTRSVLPVLERALERRPVILSLSVETSSGTTERVARADRPAHLVAPPRVAAGEPVRSPIGSLSSRDLGWKDAESADGRPVATVAAAVRDDGGKLLARVGVDVDARRFIEESLEQGGVSGDLWITLDAHGHAMAATPRAGALLGCPDLDAAALPASEHAPCRELWRGLQTKSPSADSSPGGNYRLAAARVPSNGWIFLEGYSPAALARIATEAKREVEPQSYAELRRDVVLLFLYLVVAVFGAVLLISRRISEPVQELVAAAEAIGEGRPVQLAGPRSADELGRLAVAIDRMGKRVARRVETLRRLHHLSRSGYRTTDMKEILARSSEAIGAFTRAETVLFLLYDPNTNRLEGAWPGWNVSEELAAQVKIPVDARSIAASVYKSGDAYYSNDIERDAYVHVEMKKMFGARNALFAPLKTDRDTIGVVVAINRSGGFGREEVDAITSFADVASLLLKNIRLYATLTGTVEELRRASRLKDHFLQNVNHELRTPLTAIVGWTDLFMEESLDEKTLQRGISQVRQSARVLLALIDDLLDLARMDRGSLALDRKPVSLPDVIQRSIDTVRMMADGRSVAIIFAPLPAPMSLVRADPLRLQQILWNLLANAIKFSRRHGRVVVRVEREPERYLVSVEDDGIGIPAGELSHVFERFRQVDGSPTRQHAGMGIGLALARSLVELHGGTIWADSVVGKGSRFTFTLPIRPGDRRSGEAEAAATPEPAASAAGAEGPLIG
jgi:signal transduction histidine kinase/HAMP domain-containing protein